MSDPLFCHLSYGERRFAVVEALDLVLAGLTRATPTEVVVGRVAREIGCEPGEVSGLVLSLAPETPQAKQDGPKGKRWGRPFQRWNWYPAPPALPPAVSPGPMLDPRTAPAEDWTAPAAPATASGWTDENPEPGTNAYFAIHGDYGDDA